MNESESTPAGGTGPVPDALLRASDVRKSYVIGTTAVRALDGVSLEVRAGETLCVRGPSGAGKTTLLHVLGGLDTPTCGQVWFRGRDLYRLRRSRRAALRACEIGFVFQSYHLLPELDVLENVMLPALSRRGALRRWAAHAERARGLLDQVGLGKRTRHRPSELSGGEQQRVALARSLMNDPDLVLADEPTGNLDSKTGEQVLEVLFALIRARGHTLVLVTHNDVIAGMCDRQLYMSDGRIVS